MLNTRGRLLVALALLCLVAGALALASGDAQAAAGGLFVKAIYKTWWGKAILASIFLILLPLGLYVMAREGLAKRHSLRDLGDLSRRYPYFAWAEIEGQAQRCFLAVYRKWTQGDLAPARDLLTVAYFQSQQDMLDRWREEGKRNVVELKSRPRMRPLQVR